MSKDSLQYLNEFANAISAAMSAKGIEPPDEKWCWAVMVLVGEPPAEDGAPPPIGCSLNYNREEKTWSVDAQVQMGRDIPIDEEEG